MSGQIIELVRELVVAVAANQLIKASWILTALENRGVGGCNFYYETMRSPYRRR
jgi:hypothetical protein